jgi:low affinity Fe/Cu permease
MSPEEEHPAEEGPADFPSEVSPKRTWFDRFADGVIGVVSNASFFVICMAFVLVWLAAGAIRWEHWHEWADVLAVPAAGVTLLMVALLENESRRNDQATQRKLNAMAKALADMMDKFEMNRRDVEELRSAVGLELRESTGDADEKMDNLKNKVKKK